MELRRYFQIIRRRWMIIVVCVLLAAGAAALVNEEATPQYRSTAKLFISTSTTTTDGSNVYQDSLFSQQRASSYADLIRGRNLAQLVVDRLHLDETAAQLVRQISSNVIPQTVLLQVSVTDPSPDRAQRLARVVSDEFTHYVSVLETPPNHKTSPIKVSIVDTPSLPLKPVSPKPLRNLALAIVLGLLIGLGLAVLRESLDTTVKSADDLAQLTGASLLGHVLFDSQTPKTPLITQLPTHAPRGEATRMLRTNLQFVEVDRDSRVFVVTSSVPREGKTTTAINLAIAAAKAGQSVLLLEADLRRPKVAEYLRLEQTVGLTTVLIGSADITDVIQPWGEDGLEVITGGRRPPNPAELIQSQAMASVLAKLRTRYDLVIMDAPPLLPVTDGALLSAQSDGAILVVRHGKTTKDQVTQASKHLNAVGAKIVGTVLNMARSRAGTTYAYGYGYASEETGRGRAGAIRSRLRSDSED